MATKGPQFVEGAISIESFTARSYVWGKL